MMDPISADEAARLEALACCDALDSSPELSFDRTTSLAARLFEVPIAVVVLEGQERSWIKSNIGLDASGTDRDIAVFAHSILGDMAMIVPDTQKDPGFRENPLVTGKPFARFYAGAPLITSDGFRLGSLCLIDTAPREFSAAQAATLDDLAAVVVGELEARRLAVRMGTEIAERQSAEARKMAVLDAALDGIITIDHQGQVLELNRAAEAMFGYSAKQAVGRELAELIIPPAYREAHRRGMKHFLATGEGPVLNKRLELSAVRADGTEFPIELAITKIEASGPPVFTGHIRDISARRTVETQLRMLESSVDHANDSIVITEAEPVDSPGPRIIYVNKAFTSATGYTSEEAIGQTPRILQGPNTSLEAKATIRRALKRWKPVRVELLNYRKDGTEFWVELNIKPVANEKGWYTHWVSVQRDITARKQADVQLEERVRLAAMGAEIGLTLTRNDRLADMLHHCAGALVNHLGAAFARIWTLNEATNILELQASAGAYTHLNGPHGRVPVGKFKIGLIAQERLPHLTNQVVGDPRISDQDWAQKTGMVAFAGYPLIVEDRLIGVLALFSRMTLSQPAFQALEAIANAIAVGIQHRQAEAALIETKLTAQAAQAEAERANRAKSEFLSRMSHELRTPLNAILGFGQLLEMQAQTARQRENVSHILKGGKHLLGLINEILDISRIESGRIDLTLDGINVGQVCGEAVALIQPLAAQRNIKIDQTSGMRRGYAVWADRQRLSQVMINLLSNAVKYNRVGGTATVACETSEPGRVRLSVTDTGFGIAPDDLGKLFTPFERLGAEASGVEGTGIGLALSKRLVEAMGGTMGVQSAVGQGATFYLELPASQTNSSIDEESDTPAPVALLLESPTVLCIEDNPSNSALVEQILEVARPNIRLLSATTAESGMQMARERQPGLILLDLQLPDMPGDEVLKRLRSEEKTQDIPVIMVTADATSGQARRLLDLGARSYMTKPLNIRSLLREIDDALAGGAVQPTIAQ